MVFQALAYLPRTGVGAVGEDDERKRVHNVAVQQYVKLHKLRRHKALELVIIACVALSAGFQRVEEVVHDLVQRKVVVQIDTGLVEILHVPEHTAALLTQLHYVADVIRRRINMRLHHRLIRLLYLGGVGVVGRVIDENRLAVHLVDLVHNRRRGGDKIEIVFTLQTLLYYLHVQKSQKSAAEAESESYGGFRLEGE